MFDFPGNDALLVSLLSGLEAPLSFRLDIVEVGTPR